MMRWSGHSFRFQMVSSIFGIFVLLVLSTAFILFSTVTLQARADATFSRERQLGAIQDTLRDYEIPLFEYLSTQSSNALGRLLIMGQELRSRLSLVSPGALDATTVQEAEVHALISSFLTLVDTATEDKRRRDTASYIGLYDETSRLLPYIHRKIDSLSNLRFRGQLDLYGSFITRSRNLLSSNLLFITFVSLFSIFLLLRSVEKMADPLVHLSDMALELSAGNFGIDDLGMSSIRELDQVVGAFNRMKHEVHRSIEKIKRQESLKQEYMEQKLRTLKMEDLVRRMEIYTLQAHMNPHFLFNTLNTGLQLAILERADRTGEFMEHLARLFRHNLRHQETMVSLRHEIEGLRYFFYILEVRFPRTLGLSLECPDDLLDACQVPVSILQPLVENCIVHAFRGREGQGTIAVHARGSPRDLIISVEDNGLGMDEATIRRVLDPLPLEDSRSRIMGLENVIQRLYHYYPDDPEVIHIESSPGRGCTITIRIREKEAPCTES